MRCCTEKNEVSLIFDDTYKHINHMHAAISGACIRTHSYGVKIHEFMPNNCAASW